MQKKSIFLGKLMVAGAAAIFFLFGSYRPLRANLLISPVKFELEIQPGKSFTGAFRVRNLSRKEFAVRVYPGDFTVDKNGQAVLLDEGLDENSLIPWMKISPTLVPLKPDEEKWVRFTVNMPPEKTQGLRAMIFCHAVPKESTYAVKGGVVTVSTRIGLVVYASPKGKIQKILEVSDFYAREKAADGSAECNLVLKNKGNIVMRPKANMKLLSSAGKEIASVVLSEGMAPVLPGGVRILKGNLGTALKPDDYTFVGEIDYGGDKDIELQKHLLVSPKSKIVNFAADYVFSRKRTETKGGQTAATEIHDVVAQKQPGSLLLSVKGNGRIEDFQCFEMSDPFRLVIDIPGADNKISPKNKDVDFLDIQAVRTSQFEVNPQKIVRVVVDFNKKQNYRVAPGNDSLDIAFGNLEGFRLENGNPGSSERKIVFSAKIKGLFRPAQDKSFVRIKSLNGSLVETIPLSAFKTASTEQAVEIKAEWTRLPAIGTYFAELIITQDEKNIFTSYAEIEIKE